MGTRWQTGDLESLRATLGVDDEGTVVHFDLERDGPHAVIAGTTGSGKSEALATLLASLVASYSPERLALFLVDFKGGATMAQFAEVPQLAGSVTDIEADRQLAMRAFTALDAEIVRRKRVLGEARVSDVAAYRVGGSPLGKLPSLVVVIDEFALLLQTHGQARARLDAVAAQGRSLGIHLVLATQNPSGVVSPAIRANTNLWFALRVVGEAESREIIGRPDAAAIAVETPGRGYLRRGAEDRLRTVNVARVTSVSRAGRVRVSSFADAVPITSVQIDHVTGPSDLELITAEAQHTGKELHYAPVRALWRPPLPALLGPDAVPEHEELATGARLLALLGVVDDPAQQRQDAHIVDLSSGNLLVTGGPGAGRTTALQQVAASLIETHPPGSVHLYGLSMSNSLDGLSGSPHVAGIVHADDRELLQRLVGRLGRELEARRAGGRSTGDAADARIVLLVDDFGMLRDALESDPRAGLSDTFTALLTGGRTVGIHVALTSYAPTDIRVNLLGTFGHRVVLRSQDRSDYLAVDWRVGPDDTVPALPGRGIVTGPREVQIVFPDLERSRDLATAWPTNGGPHPILRLPREVSLEGLPQGDQAEELVIGLGGLEAEPVSLRIGAGQHLVVLGSNGSGRSSTLLALAFAAALHPTRRVAVIALRRGPLDALRGNPSVVAFADSAATVDAVLTAAEGGRMLVIIDDADALPAASADRLDRLVRAARDIDVRIAIAAGTSTWSRMFDPWARQMTSSRRAIVLSDYTEVFPQFDVRVPPAVAPDAPGRGYLIANGSAVQLQLALPSFSTRS
ncbi:MAG: FtsK/SpoIIIE domain-containing protein [Rhodoglobus sp.]